MSAVSPVKKTTFYEAKTFIEDPPEKRWKEYVVCHYRSIMCDARVRVREGYRWSPVLTKNLKELYSIVRVNNSKSPKLAAFWNARKHNIYSSQDAVDLLTGALVDDINNAFDYLYKHPESQVLISEFVTEVQTQPNEAKTLMYKKLEIIFSQVLPKIQSDEAFKAKFDAPEFISEVFERDLKEQFDITRLRF